MNRLPLVISILIHLAAGIIAYFDMGSFLSPKLSDSGFAVFDFVEIGQKSKSPILSENEGRVSKTKSQNQANSTAVPKKNQSSTNSPAVRPKNKEADAAPVKPKKRVTKRHPPTPPKTKTSGKDSKKTSDKAVVNLNDNKKKKGNSNNKIIKKSFDSFLDSATAESDAENTGMKAEEVGETLTATQIDVIRQTIRKCWHFPAGLKNAEDLIVDIKLNLDPDGNVKSAEITNKDRMKKDSNFKIAAEYAYRAVLDPECNPLPLPKEKYEEWKDLELTFNPKEMFD
ncbi:MAG: hypothetical protein LBI20_02360 [Holosporales bacterium]|nr:hypothetical protein [Holosporales bacterium]